MIALITAALGVIAILLEMWVQNNPQRKKEAEDAAILQGRADIVSGNVGAVESRVDGLLAGETGTADSAVGLESAEDVERRISQL